MSFEIELAKWKSTRVVQRAKKLSAEVLAKSETLSESGLADLFSKAAAADDLVLGLACARKAIQVRTGLWLHQEQVMGALCLVWGHLAEMRTGEGKTLTVVGAAAWGAKKHGQVHVVTANGYLARRDCEKMGPIYALLGLRTSVVEQSQSVEEKQGAYACEVVYGVGHEFGFDYLRDNLAMSVDRRVQRGRPCAIVDEIDSVLIDDAKTPMILANKDTGAVMQLEQDARLVDELVKAMQSGRDYRVDLGKHEAEFLEVGFDWLEGELLRRKVVLSKHELYAGSKMYLLSMLNHALTANVFLKAGRDYVVERGEIVLVDIGTGRKMEGRRLSEGLHEALEAKEGVPVATPTKVQGSVTYQNFFGGYGHLSGLSGTVLTDADEFASVYGLSVCVIPTHRPIQRVDRGTVLFATKMAKFIGVAQEVVHRRREQALRPILVGCGSVRDARVLSACLDREGVAHALLTADNEAREAEIIGMAGRVGAVTVATNMAGRGTDILLGGGDLEEGRTVRELGGLLVLVTEHNEVRRVDDQFAGRCGRQGDPGEVVFYCSLEDDIFERFADKGGVAMMKRVAASLGDGGSGAQGPLVSRYIQMAQKKAQGEAQAARKELAKFDELMSKQRDAVFSIRASILSEADFFEEWCRTTVLKGFTDWARDWLEQTSRTADGGVDWLGLKAAVAKDWSTTLGGRVPAARWVLDEVEERAGLSQLEAVVAEWFFEGDRWSSESWVKRVKLLALMVIDEGFSAHVGHMDELRKNKSMRQHGSGMNLEYMFYLDAVRLFESYGANLGRVFGEELAHLLEGSGSAEEGRIRKYATGEDLVSKALWERWVGRNEACPCGSGEPYKKCHGKLR